jgi:hypothetical protein
MRANMVARAMCIGLCELYTFLSSGGVEAGGGS